MRKNKKNRHFIKQLYESTTITDKAKGFIRFEYYNYGNFQEIKEEVYFFLHNNYLVILPIKEHPYMKNYSVIIHNETHNNELLKRFIISSKINSHRLKDDNFIYINSSSKINGLLSNHQEITYILNINDENLELANKIFEKLS